MKQPWENAIWFGKNKDIYLTSDDVAGFWFFPGIPLVFVLNSWLMDIFVKTRDASFFILYLFSSLGMTYLGFSLGMKWFEYIRSKQDKKL